MAKTVYIKTALTGGASGALDSIDGSGLLNNDVVLVILDESVYYYTLATSGLSENSPEIIVPDTNPGTNCWILKTPKLGTKRATAVGSTATIDYFSDILGNGCIWHYSAFASSTATVRAGTITAAWDAGSDVVTYKESSTQDVSGDTSSLVFTVDINSDNVRLKSTCSVGTWEIKVIRNML